MRCAFIVQASASIGVGHLMRCLAFAQVLVKHQFDTFFLLDRATEDIACHRNDWCGDILNHDYKSTPQQQVNAFIDSGVEIDWFIIDGYQFDLEFCQTWRSSGYRVALFDDAIHQPPYGADVLINAAATEGSARDGTPIIYGPDFRLLRREFYKLVQQPVAQRECLTLSFGGSDPSNITLPLLMLLEQHAFQGPIRVVTGQAYTNLSALSAFCSTTSLSVEHVHAVQNMATVWSNSRLAVSAAGGSQFELAVCATPSILVVVADNQRKATEQAEQQGWCRVLPLTSTENRTEQLFALYATIKRLWLDQSQLECMQQAVINKYDALGAERLLAALKAYE